MFRLTWMKSAQVILRQKSTGRERRQIPLLVFISYRRQDCSAAARWLYQTIQRTFGPSRVFMDTVNDNLDMEDT